MTDYQSTYRAECAEKTAALRAKCADIVAELGNGWTVEPEQMDSDGRPYFGRAMAYLTNPDGSRVLVEPDQRGRLEILGTHEYDKRVTFPERVAITVAADRPASAIAREITRRLLPRYTAERATLAERVARTNGRDNATYKIAQAIAETLGKSLPEQDGSGSYDVRLYGSPGVHYGDIRVSGEEFTHIDISVTPALALAIAATIAAGAS